MVDSKSSQKGDQAPVCNLNIVLPDQIMPDEPSLPPSISSSPRLPLHTNRYNIKNVAYSSTPRHGVLSVGEIHRGVSGSIFCSNFENYELTFFYFLNNRTSRFPMLQTSWTTIGYHWHEIWE